MRALFWVLTFATARAAAAQDIAKASVVIDGRQSIGQISQTLYGQFAEFMFEDVKGGLHAELLRDRGFDGAPNAIGLPRYWERYPDDRDDDYGISFRWDDSVAYPASTAFLEAPPQQHSVRVDAGTGVIERHGMFQSRIPVHAGTEYRGYLWLKSAGFDGQLTVALEPDIVGAQPYAEAEVRNIHRDWTKYEFILHPRRSDPLARLAILFNGRGRVWVDQVSLLPGITPGGVRSDVLGRVSAVHPAFIRWPGGNVAQDYHWQWGVGPRDRRPVWVNLSWRNEPEPSDFGTDEFIAFSRAVGAEPSLTVNVEGRGATPEEAAAWVEYCNGAPSTRYGKLRSANGHPEPYGVVYWEIGNEIWGSWVRGHSDAETYARNFQRYHDAMRAVDPRIRFIAVGDNDTAWNRTVLRRVGRSIDYLAIHHYYGGDSRQRDLKNLMARPLAYERFYRGVARMITEEVPGHTVRLAINEWGLDLPEARQYSMESALYGARLMNVFERSSPLVGMSAVSDMVNGWPGGIIQASRNAVFVSPLYYANAMYAGNAGRELLKAEVTGPTFDSGIEGHGIQYLDASASRSADRTRIYVKLVNTDPRRAMATHIQLDGIVARSGARWELLSANGRGTHNSFGTPDAIVPRSFRITGGSGFDVRLPAQSVSVITLEIAAGQHATEHR